jgi:fimbrial chaperone protein
MSRILSAVISALFMVCTASSAFAGDFTVSPINVHIKAGHVAETITLANQSSDTLRIQVSGFAWGQRDNGEMTMDPTDDLVFFPQLLIIPPHERRAVRVGLLQPTAGPVERTYRLVLLDLPPVISPLQPQGASVTMQTQLSIPVFLDPQRAAAQPDVQIGTICNGKLAVDLLNRGNMHYQAKTVAVSGRDVHGEPLFERSLTAWYVLANGERKYDVDVDQASCARLHDVTVAVESDGGNVKRTFVVPAAEARR